MGIRLLLFVNPHSAGAAGADDARAVLAASGVDVVEEPCPAAGTELAEAIARRAAGVDGVVLGGGDGTLHAALPALLEHGLPLGVLPLGTANDFARALGLPAEPERAAAVIAAGARRRVDVGVVNGRPYLNVASVGLVSGLRHELTRERKRRLGALAYPVTALRRWWRARPFRVRVQGEDGAIHRLSTRHLAVANGPSQGGRVVDPQDTVEDAALALRAVEERGLWGVLVAHLALRLGWASATPGLLSLRGRWFQVDTEHPMAVSADGEQVGRTPARFEVRPAALEVYAPAAAPEPAGLRDDEAAVALNRLTAALAAAAEACDAAAARVDDERLATLFAGLARRRRALAELTGLHVQDLGSLPRAADPDAAALAGLWSRARALLADDPSASLLEERAAAERALAESAREAQRAALPSPAAKLVADVAAECAAAAEGLERLRAQPPSSASRSRASTE
jgi:YegS/Rv2252/BmrU family lipid kinase/uncharacterized protein (TIGR02284 family)